MNDHFQPEPEFTHSSPCEPESPTFQACGTFANITNYAASSLPPDFRMIPMGDIDLRRQIRVDERTGVAYPQWQRGCVRCAYAAKARIDGRTTRVTVSIYQGNDAEEEWRQDIATYMSLRQICGAASSNGIHATLFNDDLIPLRVTFLSPVLNLTCRKNQDFSEAYYYIYSAFHRGLPSGSCTFWIRRSTGRFCAELTPANDNLRICVNRSEVPGLSRIYPVSAETITTFIGLLTLEEYYHICGWSLGHHRWIALSADTTMNIGAVFRCSGAEPLEDSDDIAFLPSAESPYLTDWRDFEGRTGEVMPNGWTRFQSSHIFNRTLSIGFSALWDTWLSQANHIFCRLNIMSNFDDYGTAFADRFYLG
ncbi:hypothetical protein MSAN_00123500 [Mycena sanguinolenta]|uniref:Uncharacterized protein n=1 Tax=Mycena sanguinolenta TaxID=230812 RepID=A0A8H6ZGF6_9AGAR|nr:hypothetical protein MSAN_00123500 [Mycena sanguinolenta]